MGFGGDVRRALGDHQGGYHWFLEVLFNLALFEYITRDT